MNQNNNISAQKTSAALSQLSQVDQKLLEGVEEAASFATLSDSINEATLNKIVLFGAFISNQADSHKTVNKTYKFQLRTVSLFSQCC